MFKVNKKKTEFDLIFSLGAACSCSEVLRKSYLQFYSYPFDWLYGSDFSKRLDIFLNDFERYIEKEDLEFLSATNEAPINPCAVYKNNYNNIVFNHDFIQGIDFETIYPIVKEKYNRRISRLLNQVKNSKNILIVYIQTPLNKNATSNEELFKAIEKLKQKYSNKNFNILYLQCDISMKFEDYTIEKLSDKITKITANYSSKDKNAPQHAVNYKFIIKLLENFKLKLPFVANFKLLIFNRILKFIIKLFPSKKLRQKLRKRFHMY